MSVVCVGDLAWEQERRRLAAVARYGVLRTPRERDFDDLAELAARVVGLRHAFVSIVGEDVWLKSSVPDGQGQVTPRDLSFCSDVVAARAPVVVPDAAAHPRYVDHPLVVTGSVRCYVGVPILTEDGYAVGAVAAWDDEPGEITANQVAVLERLARQAVALLELRRVTTDLDEALAEQTRYGVELELARNVLARTLADEPLPDVLDALARGVERLSPGASCGILLVEGGRLRDAAGPGLPESYRRAIDGIPVGADVGSCGSAAHSGKPVIVASISTDPRWQEYREVALSAGFRACWSHPVLDGEGTAIGTFAMYYRTEREPQSEELRLLEDWADLAEIAIVRSKSLARLRLLAETDSLTGLANRADVIRSLDAALLDQGCAVLFIDLDRFKMINDSLGHWAGNAYLVDLSTRLLAVAPPGATVGRVGGDEFVVVCPAASVLGDLEELARELNCVVSAPVDLRGRSVVLTASIGIVSRSGTASAAEDLLRDADTAMYVVKRAGGNGHALFDRRLREGALERLELEAALRQAVPQGQLQLVYQPKVDLAEGRVTGFEALARWTHPHHGAVEPARFIPLAEESGLISEIGEWVLREACSQLGRWRRESDEARGLRVWVNVSARQLTEPRLPAVVQDALEGAGLEPSALGLEITESAVADEGLSLDALLRLKAIGVRIALDDFGTGYSSLARLKNLPVDVIKIDRSFVSGLTFSPQDRGIVRSIIELSAALGISNVAEGVETAEQRAVLHELGCRYGQGYLFARPLPVDEVHTALRALRQAG